MSNNQRIIVTPGEPAGIGLDLVSMLAQEIWPVELVVCADPTVLLERAQQLKLPLRLHYYCSEKPVIIRNPSELTVLPVQTQAPVIAGQLNPINSHYVMTTLSRACCGCLNGEFSAMLTGPVSKKNINDGGLNFIGHTEYLAKQSGCEHVVMMFVSDSLRVALATTHLPLLKVSTAITQHSLEKTITILFQSLKKQFNINKPHIYVCGLNPHAGEAGYIGQEENKIIIPVMNFLRRDKGYDLVGPLPADTLFQGKHLQRADAILAMYHDQGLPVFKYQSFGRAVNITLGLPFIRTSVDHGIALELAGSGKVQIGSIKEALRLAISMIKTTNRPF